ncbi:MAG: thioredoxin domain-containing protein [Pyrinomonadaceae bacterium]
MESKEKKINSKNNKDNNANSGLPLIIIGIVLLAAVVGGWYLYQSSNKKTSVTNTNSVNKINANVTPPNNTPLVSNVLGAQPPHFKGAQNSQVVLEEFADYQCPTCAVMHPVMNEVNAFYGSRIKFIYRNFPLIQIHKNSYEAAVSGEAAGLQGKFWEMQNLLFQNQKVWSNVDLVKPIFEGYAQTIGLDVEKFKSDVAGLAAKERVNRDLERGRALNINSTPTVLVNGVPVPFEQMTVDGMKKIVDAELSKYPANQPAQVNQPKAPSPANKSAEEKGVENAPANTNGKK